MTDTIIKGSGNSRSIRSVPNLAALAPTHEKLLELLTSEEGLPIDFGPPNPAGCEVIGDSLNKETLLNDATAALYGKGSNASPDDILAAIRPLITAAQNTANGKSMVQVISYTGNGNTTHTHSFSFDPQVVFIASKTGDPVSTAMIRGNSGVRTQLGSFSYTFSLSWSGSSLTITETQGNAASLNISGTVYRAVAIG